MKCSRQKEQPSSEPAADSSQSETLHRTVSAIAGHPRRKKLTSILARLSNEVEVLWEEERAEKPRAFYAHGQPTDYFIVLPETKRRDRSTASFAFLPPSVPI